MLKTTKNYLLAFTAMLILTISLNTNLSNAKASNVPFPGNKITENFRDTTIKVSDKEMKSFIKASDAIEEIRRKMNREIERALNDNNFTIDRYRTILKHQQPKARAVKNESLPDTVSISQDELKRYNEVKQTIIAIQKRFQDEMDKKLGKYDLTRRRFLAIASAIPANKSLQDQFEKLQQ